jgi:hypothetical protein
MIQDMNDSSFDAIAPWLRVLNGVGAVIAAGFAVAALVVPDLLLRGGVTDGMRFYADVYAARQLPFTLVLLFVLVRSGRTAVVPMLVAGGLIQAADVAVGLAWSLPNMVAGGALLAAIHLGSALWLHSGRRTERRRVAA